MGARRFWDVQAFDGCSVDFFMLKNFAQMIFLGCNDLITSFTVEKNLLSTLFMRERSSEQTFYVSKMTRLGLRRWSRLGGSL